MIRGKITLSLVAVMILVSASALSTTSTHSLLQQSQVSIEPQATALATVGSLAIDVPEAIVVSDDNPFYALLATPLAVSYNEEDIQQVVPLYVKNEINPSKAVERVENDLGYVTGLTINSSKSLKEWSMYLIDEYWESSDSVILIEENQLGYNLGVVATPLASYLGCPLIITDEVDSSVQSKISDLGVTTAYICGDLSVSAQTVIDFESVDEIISTTIDILDSRFDHIPDYITITNPHDVIEPTVLDSVEYPFEGYVGSSITLPSQFFNMLLRGNSVVYHDFTIPQDYKYARISLDLENLNVEHVDELGDRMFAMILSPEPDRHQYVYASTGGGLPERDVDGSVTRDLLHFETVVYDQPGDYQLMVLGHWFGSLGGDYEATVTVEKLESPIDPMMNQLSSLTPYLTAKHQGIIFAKPEFAFAADDDVIYNGSTCPGVSQPGTNWKLIEPSNQHTMDIHEQLNQLLAQLADIPLVNLEELRNHYVDNPVYIAIAGDPTMVPMYFYYNPDGRPNTPAYIMGFALPSDYIYGDIDPKPDDPENNTFSYWPYMENIVGRVTGRDVQDMSALLARTFFYNEMIDDLGSWKNNGLVQTGCGLEFQNLPIFTRLSKVLNPGARDEPTKFPTGESTFINWKLKEDMETGDFDTKSTLWLQSQTEGFSEEGLNAMKQAGLLNRLLFPKNILGAINGVEAVTGGPDQLNASLIFAFAHGFYNLYEFGDVLTNSRGFPFVTMWTRILPRLGSSLADKGSFDVRTLENMDYGPSVIFIVSCITGRTDGILPENTLSQTYLHAGTNAYIGATRVTADPGYLEPRPFKDGKGFGILGLLNATYHYKIKGEFPDMHFGALIGEDFILNLIDDDDTTGRALRDAKNVYLEKDANATFLWTPPLMLSHVLPKQVTSPYMSSLESQENGEDRTRVLDKKYVALHEFTLYGDPAFNPYQPVNNG